MAHLTVSERAKITTLIRTLKVSSSGKFLDATSVERLTRIFRNKSTFICGCGSSESGSPATFQVGMREQPFVTLLTALLAADAGTL